MKNLIIAILFIFAAPTFAQQIGVGKEAKDEINKLVESKRIKQAFATIVKLEPETRTDHIELTEIPAPPFKETVRGLEVKKRFEQIGLTDVWIDEVGNVIGRRKGKKGDRVVAIDAHLDTVFPEGTDVTVKIVGDTLKAPGIGDDTRGLAALLTILKAVEKSKIQTDDDILFIASVGEEGLGDLRGMKELFSERGPKIDSWISIDGIATGRVTIGGLGSKRYKAIFKGPGGHSWGAFGLVNTHHALGKAIDIFAERAEKFSSGNHVKVSYNVGRIGGGTSVNSIPFESWMEVDMRCQEPESLDKMEAIFKSSMEMALNLYNEGHDGQPQLELELIKIGDRPSGMQSEKLPLAQRAAAAAQHIGSQPFNRTGSTNSNIPISMGIPAVTIGAGGEALGAHSLHEWWVNKEGHKAIQMGLLLLVAEAGLAN